MIQITQTTPRRAALRPYATPARCHSALRPHVSGEGEAGVRDSLDDSWSYASGLPLGPAQLVIVRGWFASPLALLDEGEWAAARYQATIQAKKLHIWGRDRSEPPSRGRDAILLPGTAQTHGRVPDCRGRPQ